MTRPILERIEHLATRIYKGVEELRHEWVIYVAWADLLLVSWPIPAEQLRPFIPSGVELDTFDGTGWLSIVPFNAVDMHFRGLPAVPGQGSFPELNLRTYARLGDSRGVVFISLDCPGLLANLIGKYLFHLPFKEAEMSIAPAGDGFRVQSKRTAKGEPPASFVATYRPVGDAATPAPGTLDDFLTNRLSLFFAEPGGKLHRGDIAHDPWMAQACEASIEVNTVAEAAGIKLPPTPPHAIFARKTDTLVYPTVTL